ncbi:MAG: Druantia anti-phage system protein DruA [Sedimenticola sp.]
MGSSRCNCSAKSDSRLWNEYIERYHYLSHKPLPGAQLCYLVQAKGQLIVLLGFGAAAWQTAPRDRYIGWTHDQRKKNLHLIVNKASASCSRPLPPSL